MSAATYASLIWDDEHHKWTLDKVPPHLRAEVQRLLNEIQAINAQQCKDIDDGYEAIQRRITDKIAEHHGETVVLASESKVTLPQTSGVITVQIPAGRLPKAWELRYPEAVSTQGDVTTIRSRHRSLVVELLRLAGF